jgi:hypothetical protein
MVWYNPFTWSSETTPSTPTVSTLPEPTQQPIGARRKTRHGRKGSKRYHSKRVRTGRKSIRS